MPCSVRGFDTRGRVSSFLFSVDQQPLQLAEGVLDDLVVGHGRAHGRHARSKASGPSEARRALERVLPIQLFGLACIGDSMRRAGRWSRHRRGRQPVPGARVRRARAWCGSACRSSIVRLPDRRSWRTPSRSARSAPNASPARALSQPTSPSDQPRLALFAPPRARTTYSSNAASAAAGSARISALPDAHRAVADVGRIADLSRQSQSFVGLGAGGRDSRRRTSRTPPRWNGRC